MTPYGTKQEEAEEKVQWEALGIQDDPYEIVTVDRRKACTGEDGVALESTVRWLCRPKCLPGRWMCIGSEDYMDGFEFKDEYFMDLTKLLPEDVYRHLGSRMINTAFIDS